MTMVVAPSSGSGPRPHTAFQHPPFLGFVRPIPRLSSLPPTPNVFASCSWPSGAFTLQPLHQFTFATCRSCSPRSPANSSPPTSAPTSGQQSFPRLCDLHATRPCSILHGGARHAAFRRCWATPARAHFSAPAAHRPAFRGKAAPPSTMHRRPHAGPPAPILERVDRGDIPTLTHRPVAKFLRSLFLIVSDPVTGELRARPGCRHAPHPNAERPKRAIELGVALGRELSRKSVREPGHAAAHPGRLRHDADDDAATDHRGRDCARSSSPICAPRRPNRVLERGWNHDRDPGPAPLHPGGAPGLLLPLAVHELHATGAVDCSHHRPARPRGVPAPRDSPAHNL